MYTSTVMDHFRSPRNVGDLPNADGVGNAGQPHQREYDRVVSEDSGRDRHGRQVQDLRLCGVLAASSMVTEWVIGRTIEEAASIENDTIAVVLGGLPPTKMHCSAMAADGVRTAIEDYRTRQGAKHENLV